MHRLVEDIRNEKIVGDYLGTTTRMAFKGVSSTHTFRNMTKWLESMGYEPLIAEETESYIRITTKCGIVFYSNGYVCKAAA